MKNILFFVTISSALLAVSVKAQDEKGWQAAEDVVEKLSKSRTEFNYYEDKVPSYTLPVLLESAAGRKILTKNDWLRIRRPELLELFRTNVYGRIPSTPYKQTFVLVSEDKNAMSGQSTMKQVDINIESGGKSLVIHLVMYIPNNASGPSPLFLLINNRGPANTDQERLGLREFWPAEEAVARGYAIAVFYNADVDPDNYDEFKNGIHGVLDPAGRSNESWGTLAAWAWGASRCMDYFETDKDVNRKRVAVVGHSRGGKTALWAGAEDQRFALVVSNESGCGGAALARRRFGETVARINTSFPHWFCLNYRKYNDNEDSLPVDMHMLLALMAPRAVYVACASDDLWGDPKGSYLALYNSLPAFRLFNRENELPVAVPPLNKPVMTGNVAYHIRPGEHNLKPEDWNRFMDFADRLWK